MTPLQKRRFTHWRVLRHPLRLALRGWRVGRRALISPRGTVFETCLRPGAILARKRCEFELKD